mgnify:CR=1 FL=1
MMDYPVLYTFRRCPYAMRARMALKYAKISYIHREVKLSERPKELYKISSKGTVPVLHISGSRIIQLDISVISLDLNGPIYSAFMVFFDINNIESFF